MLHPNIGSVTDGAPPRNFIAVLEKSYSACFRYFKLFASPRRVHYPRRHDFLRGTLRNTLPGKNALASMLMLFNLQFLECKRCGTSPRARAGISSKTDAAITGEIR